MRNVISVGLVVVGLLLVTGCSDGPDTSNLPATADASGVVLLDGSPCSGAAVVFIPKDGKYPASGLTDAKGRFELKAFEAKDGAVPGAYAVQISKTVEVTGGGAPAEGADSEHAAGGVGYENALPAKYADMASSGFTADLPETGKTDFKFELSSEE